MGSSKIKTQEIKHYFYLGTEPSDYLQYSKGPSNKARQDQNEVIPINVNLGYDSVKIFIVIPDKTIRNTRLSANKYLFFFTIILQMKNEF